MNLVADVQSRNEADLAALQGIWIQTHLEENGHVNPPDTHGANGALTTFAGNEFAVYLPDGTLMLEGTFTLDASLNPRLITWIDSMGSDKGKMLLASYDLEGDNFRFIAADEGLPQPTAFQTGPGQTMRTFVRR